MKKVYLILIVLTFCFSASAQKQPKPISKVPQPDKTKPTKSDGWKVIGFEFNDKSELITLRKINPDKIIRNGSNIEFWIKEIPMNGQKYWERKTYTLIQFRGDCAKRLLGIFYIVEYAPGKDYPKTNDFNRGMETIIPDSVGEELLTKACALK